MLTVKHHTAEFMLQHGVSAERIGLLAPLRLRRRNMGHGQFLWSQERRSVPCAKDKAPDQ